MFVKPKSGLLIKDPIKRDFLPETGREVSGTDPYWVRRLRDGDVEESTQKKSVAKSKGGNE